MSIQTTQIITRKIAIERISEIACHTYNSKFYPELEECFSNEDNDLDLIKTYNRFLSSFIITLNDMRLPLGDTMFNNVEDMKNVVEIFPTKTLESFMDMPGVRFSQFENYLIETGECNG